MTREETEKRIAIMQAYVDGKAIEFYDKLNGKWTIAETPHWDSASEYRIKPETKYRPFKNVKECWQEMQKHQPFGWIISKTNIEHLFITYIKDDISEYPFYLRINGEGFDFELIFNDFTFTDGTPFGVKEEGA